MYKIKELIYNSIDLTLLYVEDDENTRDSTLFFLSEIFPNIIVAVDGQQGYEKFKENDIDLIISDISMPNMDGLVMANKIKEISRDTPIFIFSAFRDTDFFMDAFKIGIDGYLLKPIDTTQFVNIVYRSVESIKLKREAIAYKNSLELKVQEQLKLLRDKDLVLFQQSKMASMGEIMDIVAHQWKQPLNAIIMQTDLIKDSLNDGALDNEMLQDALDIAESQVNHLVNTLNEFRRFFEQNNDTYLINIRSLLSSISILIKDELIKNLITLEILCEDEIVINAIENDIKHLILNLINNAKDEIVNNNIKNRVILIECFIENKQIILKVKDNGRGIPEDIIDNIFDSHITTKKEFGGSGIGLYMSKLIVDKYNATIDVKNDNGAIFTVSF